MRKGFHDLTGMRFGRLVVLEFVERKQCLSRWRVRCDCGAVIVTAGAWLKSGETKSCGCFRRERIVSLSFKHGELTGNKKTPEYIAWKSMRSRCERPKDARYPRYGGRGISVCDRWKEFENFLSDMGRKPSANLSIERIDNDKGYEPGNCKWATLREQARNKSNNRHYGRFKTIKEAAQNYGLQYKTVIGRLHLGWSMHDALTRPVKQR